MVGIEDLGEKIAPDEKRDRNVEFFLEIVKEADGRLIPLPQIQSLTGEPLLCAVKFGPVDSLSNVSHLLLVDVFAERNEEMVPVAHADFEVKVDEHLARLDKNRHGGHLPTSRESYFQAADKRWSQNGLETDED